MSTAKEKVHDEQIVPLMREIIAICKEHNIAFFASFAIDEHRLCTSALLENKYDPPEALVHAFLTILPPIADED